MAYLIGIESIDPPLNLQSWKPTSLGNFKIFSTSLVMSRGVSTIEYLVYIRLINISNLYDKVVDRQQTRGIVYIYYLHTSNWVLNYIYLKQIHSRSYLSS